jgi:transposase-like protein
MRTGRPTKYKSDYCDIAETLLGQGKAMWAVAAALGINRCTLRDWKKKYPKFSAAVDRGRTNGMALFMEKLEKAAWDPENYKVNNRLVFLLAMNQYGMTTGKKRTLSLADAVRRRHEAMASSLCP